VERVEASNRFATTLVSCHVLAPGILEVHMRRPAGFNFLPGQFLRVIMDDYQRDYTIVSGSDAETLDFCIAMVAGGRFSDAMGKAKEGDSFRLCGPHGHFIFQGSAYPPVFVATGTGVAPFVAFCRNGASDALLLHGVTTPGQLIYRHLLEPHVRAYVPCISGPFNPHGSLAEAFAGRVTAYLETMLAPGTYDFYLCGQSGMIRDATALIDERFDGSRLFIENFD
jgi:benzoate/toluate 1,2-dioxygenase reductase component